MYLRNFCSCVLGQGALWTAVRAATKLTSTVKLLHPKYSSYLQQEQRTKIHKLVRGLIDLLSSDDVVVDYRHSPKLWSRFLDGLLATPNASMDIPPTAAKGESASTRKSSRKSNIQSGASSSKGTSSNPSTPSVNENLPLASPPVTSPATENTLTSSAVAHTSQTGPNAQTMSQSNSMYNYQTTAPPSSSGSYQMVSPLDQPKPPGRNEQDYMSGMYDDTFQMNVSEYFRPAFPLGQDMIQSMQAMDASLWQNVPGMF